VEATPAADWPEPPRRGGRAADATVAILPEPQPRRQGPAGRELVLEAEPDEAPEDPRGLGTLAAELLDEETGPVAGDAFAPDSLADAPFAPSRREPAGQATELFDLDASEPGPAAPLLPAEDSGLARASVLDPGRASGFDVSAADLGEPMPAPVRRAPPPPPSGVRRPAAAEVRAPRAPRAPAAPAAPAAADVVRELAPRLRESLHDTLEKVAWESFGSMAEEIVRRAVERVEAVAWEVIPQMAETLIREELRRIKGEGDDSEP
jgi:hypothetical protein